MTPETTTPPRSIGRPRVVLETLGQVRREMAQLYFRLKKRKVEPQEGGVMANVLGMLAKTMEHSIRDYSDEEILAEWDRRKTERQKAGEKEQ